MWVRDLNSSNGLYHDGRRVQCVPITRSTTVRLGIEGPEISFEPQMVPEPHRVPTDPQRDYPSRDNQLQPAIPKTTGSGTILRRYVDHYFRSSTNAPAGEHTMYVRRAFEKAQTQQKRRYGLAIGLIVSLAIGVGTYALYERRQLGRQRALAKDLFYAMKTLDLDITNLEKAVAQSGNWQKAQMVRQYSSRRREMQSSYDQYLTALHVYDRKMTEQQRIMLRVARVFGECELDMPPDFEAEVNKYIKYWRQRFKQSL